MIPKRILVLHNRHITPGGEDTVVDLEAHLLLNKGHEVDLLEVNNADIPYSNLVQKINAGFRVVWSKDGYEVVTRALTKRPYDLIHVHNTFTFFSPSVFWAIARFRIPTVATLHNYKPVCAQGGFLLDKAPCFKCLSSLGLPISALQHSCYNGSLPGTVAVASMQVLHSTLRTYSRKVHLIIVPSKFGVQTLGDAGWCNQQLHYKPHFMEDPVPGSSIAGERERVIIYVGRISPEKGVDNLLSAWSQVAMPKWRLLIVGSGAPEDPLKKQYSSVPSVEWLPWRPRDEVIQLLLQARFAVTPSLWHEPFGMTALEALACGTPVLAAKRGGLMDLISDQSNGLLFEPDVNTLKQALVTAMLLPAEQWQSWSANARQRFLGLYTPEANYPLIIKAYEKAIGNAAV